MQWIYQLIVLFLTINLAVYMFREKRLTYQICAGMVLMMFLLRLFLIK